VGLGGGDLARQLVPVVACTYATCLATADWTASLRSFAAFRSACLATSRSCAWFRNTVATVPLAWFSASVSVLDWASTWPSPTWFM